MIKGRQKYKSSGQYQVEGDWSNSAFWLCAGVFSKDGIKVKGLKEDSLQGDRAVINVLKDMGAKVEREEDGITVSAGALEGIEIEAHNFLDIVPILSVVMRFAQGKSSIYGIERLRYKESDRLLSVSKMINDLGGRADVFSDCLDIHVLGLIG